MYKLFVFLFLFCSTELFAQSPKFRVNNIPVERKGSKLRMPWVGGLNSPQFSEINLNGDSYPDLFVFDRVGDKVLTFVNNGTPGDTAYRYAPQFERLFPSDLKSWALIRDYNNDGVPDIFTHANTGTRVYKGSNQGGTLSFNLVNDLLTYFDGTFHVNIWTNVDDIPVFTDVNRDGDMDVLTFGIFGSAVEYYENQTVENGGTGSFDIDSFQFKDGSLCWGNFTENSLTNAINLNISCKGEGHASATEGARHVGSTIFDFDADNDHDVDLLIGDISFNSLVFVQNCGDSAFANACSSDSTFPSCNQPVNIPVFPAAYSIDADNDGDKDLLVSPNARVGIDVDNVLFYKNVNSSCGWAYQTDSFLVKDILDFGTDSKPCFFDFNYDGLQDIVIGNYGYYQEYQPYKSTIAVYENVGSASEPAFKLLSENYNNFSNFNLVALHPAFGDLDGDNLPDMVVGELQGFLHYFKNTGLSSANFPSMTTPQFFGLDVGLNSAPFIYDVNNDSLNDLVVGRKDGKLTYFWNFGTKNSPQFHPDSANTLFGGLTVTVPGFTEGYSNPFLVKNSDGNTELYVGTNRGLVYRYAVDSTKWRSGAFALIDSNFIGEDVGSESTISITDINGDGKLEYLLGNSRGGLLLYSDTLLDTSIVISLPDLHEGRNLKLYPNPARDILFVELGSPLKGTPAIEIYDLMGRHILFDASFADNRFTVHATSIQSGMYVLLVSDGEQTLYSKFCITH
jgi:hypothetical protein